MELFLDERTAMPAKLAAAMVRLSENAHDWQSEMLNELYRQAPYVGDFDPRIIINELDPERRYAMGVIELKNQLAESVERNRTPDALQGVRRVFIPIIVKEGQMFPFDLFMSSGRVQPLTETRLRRAMFRPQLFDAVSMRPGDQDMMNVLYPPERSGVFGVGGNSHVGQIKTSSARYLIDSIADTIRQQDIDRVEAELAGDAVTRTAVLSNPATRSTMAKIASLNPQTSSAGMAKIAMQNIPPKVIQVSRSGPMFKIKTANPNALLPQEDDVTRPEAENIVGADIVKQVERDGSVTLSTDAVVKDTLVQAEIGPIDKFGEYKVTTLDGKEIVGWAFPKVIDMDGTQLPLAVFSNGSQAAFQDQIAGSLVGLGTNLIDEKPRDLGCFYLARQGSVVALVPMHIQGAIQDPDLSAGFLAETVMGQAVRIKKLDSISTIQTLGDNEYAIPSDCGWLPLRNLVDLSSDASEYTKYASARALPQRVEVCYGSGTYSMKGAPLEKLAQVLPTHFITEDQAVFNLALLGVDPRYATEKLAQARTTSDWYAIDRVRPVTLARETFGKCKKAAAKRIQRMPRIKELMLKEAAVLDDPLSVDKVLAIGFINPENVSTFVSYLPDFEHTLNRLAELLIAARLGLQAAEPGVLERLIKHFDRVITGLRELSQHPQA